MSGWLWGGCGSVVRALVAKARGYGFDSQWLPGCFSYSKLSDVDGMMSSVVFWYSLAAITTEVCMCMPVGS